LQIKASLEIRRLSLSEHRKILQNLDLFWLSKTEFIRPYHHALFSLLFADSSFALYKDSELVSYLYGACNRTKAFIHIIATRPQYYKNGYASILLRHFENTIKEKNINRIWTYIVPENSRSKIFFEKNGFIMRKEILISTDEKRILFRKTHER